MRLAFSTWKRAAIAATVLPVLLAGAPSRAQATARLSDPASPALVSEATSSSLEVRNIAGDFLTFWDATQGLSTDERVVIFKRDVAPKFPGFYGHARFNGMTEAQRDGTIARSIEAFGSMRDAYVAKLQAFDSELSANMAAFTDVFSDFQPASPVWVVHSLGEFDGGTRTVDGTSSLFFGMDGMVAFHGKDVTNESAFFHHELFHLYHQPRFKDCQPIWCSLWREGLANYVASQLNPDANEAELLLTAPNDMAAATRAQMLLSLLALREVLRVKDAKVYGELFGLGGPTTSDLPQRRGYYLGYVVARHLGQTYSLRTLANMPAAQAEPLVIGAVDELIAQAR